MGIRWKGKGAEAKALADPMSKIVFQLQSSLIKSDSQGLLSGESVLYEADVVQTDLLNRSCFGRPVISTAEKDKQWFQLSMEESFYLCHSLKCLKICGEGNCTQTDEQLWSHMMSRSDTFPELYKAYSHLRAKNWVVRSGSQYGIDFVAYRHHPSLVHSEYAVLVLSEGNACNANGGGRLRVWSDVYCTIRLCGSVAKTLLVLSINRNGASCIYASCLQSFSVEEYIITRWSPEGGREDTTILENGTKS